MVLQQWHTTRQFPDKKDVVSLTEEAPGRNPGCKKEWDQCKGDVHEIGALDGSLYHRRICPQQRSWAGTKRWVPHSSRQVWQRSGKGSITMAVVCALTNGRLKPARRLWQLFHWTTAPTTGKTSGAPSLTTGKGVEPEGLCKDGLWLPFPDENQSPSHGLSMISKITASADSVTIGEREPVWRIWLIIPQEDMLCPICHFKRGPSTWSSRDKFQARKA